MAREERSWKRSGRWNRDFYGWGYIDRRGNLLCGWKDGKFYGLYDKRNDAEMNADFSKVRKVVRLRIKIEELDVIGKLVRPKKYKHLDAGATIG